MASGGQRAPPSGPYAARTVALPEITSSDQGVRITRERRKLHAMTFTGSNFLGRMNGQWIIHDIPPIHAAHLVADLLHQRPPCGWCPG